MIVSQFFYKFRFLWKATAGVVFLLNAIIYSAVADTVVIPATGGNNLCVGGNYVTLSDITVKEGDIKDFKEDLLDLIGKNFILVLPSSNFEFEPGVGTVQLISGSGSVLNAFTPIQVTSNSITVNFSKLGDDSKMDGFIISGIRIKAISVASSGEILRKSPFNSTVEADLKSNQPSNSINHGSISSIAPTSASILSSSDADNTICAGDLVTFTATPIAGATHYEFFVNGVSTSISNSNTFSTNTLANGQNIAVRGITTNGCSSVLSNTITTTVVPVPVAAIASSDPDNSICSGESVSFTATHDVSISNYEFFINGISKQSGSTNTFSTSSLTNGQTVTVKTTSLNNCVATSTGITTQVYSKPSVTLTSNDTDNTICAGQSVTFTAESVNATSFDFFVNSISKQHSTLPTYTSTSLANGDIVSVVARNNLGCSATQTLTPFTVYPVPSVTVSSSDDNNTICAGQSVTFTALATGATTFEFFVNDNSLQNSASSTYTTSSLTNGATVYVKAGNASSCSTSSNVITTAVQKLPTVTLSSSDTDNTICAGEPVTFTAASDIGINYEFILAGVSVQNGNSNTYATTSLTDGQIIFVKVTSAEGCSVTSTAIKTTVFPVPTITLTSSDTDNSICSGESVSFTATEITSATYEFIRNGSVVLVGPQRVYTTNLLTDEDEITVRVTSANNCTGVSNTIRTQVNSIPSLTLSSSDADNTICQGESVTFTAISDIATRYEFMINGTVIQNSASNIYSTSTLIHGQSIAVRVATPSGCTDLSSAITFTVNPLPVKPTVSITSGIAEFCQQGTNHVTLQSSASSGNQWFKDGILLPGETNQTITLTEVAHSGKYVVQVTNSDYCKSLLSDPQTVTVHPLPVANLPVSVNSGVCEGTSANVTVSGSQTGINYELYHNTTLISGPVGGTGNTITLSTGILSPGAYTLIVKATNPITGCSVELANTASVTINTAPSVSLSSSNGGNSICPGESVTFTANSATAVNYEFFVDGLSKQNGPSHQFTTSVLTNNQTVYVEVNSAENCKKRSNSLLIDVNPLLVTVSSSDPNNNICAGEPVTFTASASVATVSSYEFFVNGLSQQNGPANTFTTSLLTNGQTVTVKATTATGCSATSSGITTIVNALPVIALSSTDSDNKICQGETVTFTANAPTATTYEFFVNGLSVQNSATNLYTTSSLTNGQTVTVKATTATGCSATSSGITTTVNPLPAVSLSSSDADNTICQGEQVTFTANSATAVNYEFFVDGLSKQNGTSHQFITNSLTSGQVISVTVKDNNGCSSISNLIPFTVSPIPVIILTSMDADNTICPGEPVTFTASASVATVSSYEFFVNGLSQQNGPANTFTTSLLTNGQTVTVKATTATGCSATSSGVTTFVNILTATLSSTDSDNKICQGETVTFTANAPTATTYEFFVNGLSVQNSATNLYTTSSLTNGQTVTVKATTATGCSATSSGITTTVNPLPAVSLSSSDADNTICQGEQVTFTANSATAVNYEFFVDGISKQNGTSHQFITNSLTSGQSITVLVTTAQGCSTMSSAISTVVKNLPLIVLSSSDLDNTICPGETVTFSAYSPTGTNYIFFVDGVSVQNSPSNVYTTSTLSDGQTLKVLVTSADGCSSTSTGITTTVIDFTLTLTSSDADNTICPGEAVTFTAVSSAATSFEFFVNGLSVQSGTSNTFTTSSLTDGQLVYVKANTSACSLNSQTIKTTIESLTVSLASSDSDNKICLSQAVVFTATAPSTATYFEFFLDGVSVQAGTAKTYTTSALTNGQNIWVVARTISGCTATSNSINTAIDEIAVSLTSSASDNKICQGEMVTFTANSATAVNYEFFVNGVSVQNSATNLYTTSSLTNGQVLTVKATTAYGCTIVSSGITTTVNAVPVLTLTSSDADNIICQGETVTFTASSTVAASFDFLINGSVVQSGAANTFTTTGLTNGQTVMVRATTTNSCAALSSGITITVNPMPVVSLVSSDADNAICQGETVTFTANSASASNYKFYVNGTLVQDGAFPTYLTSGLTNGQTVTVRATTASGCSILSSGITTTVNPLPTVVLTSSDVDNIICQGENVTFKANSATATTYEFFVDGVPVQNSATNLYISSSLTNGQTVTVRVFTANACSVFSTGITTTVNAVPVLTLTSSDADNAICQGETVTFTASSTVAASFDFLINGSVVQSGTANTFTTTGLTNGQTVTVRATTTNSCAALSSGITITVNSMPVVSLVSSDADNAICQGETVTFTASSTVAASFDFLINGSVVQSGTANTFTTTGLTNGQTVTVRATTASGCSTLSSGITTTVNAVPVITLTSSDADNIICQGETVTFTASSSIPVSNYKFYVNGTLVQEGAFPTYLTSGLTNGQTVTVRATTASGCSILSSGITTTVNPLPTVVLTSSDVDNIICQGENVTFKANSATATTYEFFVDGVPVQNSATNLYISSALTNGQTVTVRVSTANACSILSAGITTAVNDLPSVTLTSSDADNIICQGETVTFKANSATATTYEFFVDGVSVQNSATNLYISSALTNGQTVKVKATTASGCFILSSGITTTVNPLPVITLTSSDADNIICQGEAVTFTANSASASNYKFYVNGTLVQDGAFPTYLTSGLTNGQTVTVRATTASGCSTLSSGITTTVNPLPTVVLTSSDVDNIICQGETVTFTANSSTAVKYEFFVDGAPVQNSPSNKYTTSSLVNGQSIRVLVTTAASCQATSNPIIFQVNPVVTVNAGADMVVCEGEPIVLTGTSSLEGNPVTVTWSGGLGMFNDIHLPSATYTPAPSEIGKTVVLTLTTVDPDGAGPCSEVADQVRVQINALPTVIFTGLGTAYCIDAASSELTGFPAGGVFSGKGTDNSIAGKNFFIPSLAGVGTHIIRYTYTDANACTNYFERSVVVHPLPSVSFTGFNSTGPGGTAQYPQDAPSIVLTGSPAGGFFTGKGLSANVFNAGAAGPGTHVIRYTYNDENGCVNFQDQTVTVLPLPEVGIGTMPDQFCSKDPDYLMTGTPAGGTFSGPGVIGGTTVFRPSNAFIGANTIRYTYKDPVSGGTNFIEKTIILYKVPDVTFSGLNASYCVDGAHAELNGFPADNDGPGNVLGVFKGPGVYPGAVEGSYLFNPSAAGTGTHRITYVFTNENGCTDSTSKQVIVHDLPLVTFSGLESLYCVEAPSAKLVGFPSGGNFSGTGISGYSFIPSLAGPGIHTITYTYTNSNGCTSTQQQQVTIYPMPVANFRFEKVCDNDEVSFSDLTPTTGSGAITAWEWNFGDPVSGSLNTSNEQNPFHLFTGPGTYSVTLKVVSAYGCENTKTMAVTIGSIPKPDFSWSGICLGESVQFTHQSTVSFSTVTEWDWNFGDGTSNKVFSSTEQVAHPYASPGRYIVTLTVKTNLGCTNSIAKEIYVLPSVNTYPYFENFETTNGGWIQDGIQSSWEHGKPAGSTIAYAASGTNAWITGLATTYNINEKSYVYSPCFDFTKLTKPMISLNIWNHTQQGFDGAVLQSSVDGGLTWFNVGTIGEGINWYNQSAIIGNPGNQVIGQNGWSGMDDQWQSAKFALDNLKGYTSVRFRIAFGSNNDNPPNQILDGFAFDDVYIGERDRTVLLEHFTNSSSTESLEENAFINRLSVDTDEVVSIQYHTNFPGADPLNEVNPADPSARALFYGIPQSPRTAIDGYTVNQKFSGWGLPILSRRKLTETAFKIDVAFPVTADQYLTIKTDLTALLNVSDTLTVHVAVIEKQLTNLYDGAPVFRNVLRKMLPNAAGTKFTRTWQPGDTHSMEVSWQPVNIKDASQLAVVVFIQNDRTKEIYQAIFKQPSVIPTIITGMEPAMAETNTFTLYPNPATQKTSISFNQPVTQEYTWTIYDVVGRKIAQGVLGKGQKEVLIDVASYAEGSYVVHLSSRNKSSWYKKLLILHNK